MSKGMSKGISDEQAEDLRHLLQRMFRRFGALAAHATPCGKPLPMAYAHALMVLLTRGELSQQELGRELCIDKSNIARLCARMVEAGHVEQRSSEHDGRSRRVSLTARGKRLACEVDASSRMRFGMLLDALPEDRRIPVLDSLQHLVAAIDELSPASPSERKSE